MRPLAGGDVAVVLWNRGTCGTRFYHSFNWTAVGLPADEPRAVRDLFLKADLGGFTGSYGDFVRQLRHCLGPFPTDVSTLCDPTRA